jgi:1-aminocyclopropane-1-carboxylate deaminase/D-cysteine desulfhydrase-like pyridoxal-dependent ACC family enzyme
VRKNSRRILTAGSAASHHVLATAIFARQIGLPVTAVLCPQAWTAHAEATFRATLKTGIETVTVGSMKAVPLALARIRRRGDYFVPPGGTNALGTLAYLHAVAELLQQIRDGELPEPDLIVAALGSGGTVAGLLAGVLRHGLRSRVLGVDIATSKPIGRAMALGYARGAMKLDGGETSLIRLSHQLDVDGSARGRGYGFPTRAGDRAIAEGHSIGLELDPTYTAKTFGQALGRCRAPDPPPVVLYWHTLSSAPLEPLCRDAPEPIEGLLFPSGLTRKI